MAKKNGDTRDSAAPPVTTEVTLGIQVAAPPDDLLVGAQIDSRRLTMKALKGNALASPGMHTASWGVVSPTVKPLEFGVTITASDGRTLLSRPNEKTGSDGLGVGADLFIA